MRRLLTTLVACVLLAGGSVSAGAVGADRLPALCDGSWRYPKPIPHSSGYTLKDVVVVAQKDVWVVGTAQAGPLALHWDGYGWQRTAVPITAAGATLDGVAAGPGGDVWAVGRTSGTFGAHVFVLHWNGSRWTLAHSPTMHPGLAGPSIAVLNHQEVWVIAGHTSLHRRDGGWTHLRLHGPTGSRWALTAVAAESSTNVWASGWASSGAAHTYDGGLLEHWNGRRWSLRAGYRIPFHASGVDAVESDVMVVGVDDDTLWGRSGRWKNVRTPTLHRLTYLERVLSDVIWASGRKAWVVGTADSTSLQTTDIGYIIRWDGHRWHRAWRSPSYRSDLTAVDSVNGSTWAVGGTAHGVIVVRRC